MRCEQCALEIENLLLNFLTKSGAFAAEFGGEWAIHAAFVSGVKSTSPGGVEQDTALGGFEVFFRMEGAVIKEIQCQTVGDGGAEGFDEIQSEGRTVRRGLVEKTEPGIESA